MRRRVAAATPGPGARRRSGTEAVVVPGPYHWQAAHVSRRNIPAYLKVHRENPPEPPPSLERDPAVAELCAAFRRATGWPLQYASPAPSAPVRWAMELGQGDGPAAGSLYVASEPAAGGSPASEPGRRGWEDVQELATQIGRTLGQLHQTRRALWEREAELAAGVPVAVRPDDEAHLAVRLEAILKAGARAAGCHAAALYMLDEATSMLKMRACWGLDRSRLLAPPRPLRGAAAELEALLGHAVVLENTAFSPGWTAPEPFPAAVCVPVSTPTTPVGVLWTFAKQTRRFSRNDLNILELTAGRAAAELEREMLLQHVLRSRQWERQWAAAAKWQSDRQPPFAPLLDGWEVAGWSSRADWVGGAFHDWTVLSDGELAVTAGGAAGPPLEAALSAAVLQAAWRAHAQHRHDVRQLLDHINETLWTSSPGDHLASLAYARVSPETGRVALAAGGAAAALAVRPDRRQWLGRRQPPLGESPDHAYRAASTSLRPGETLVLLAVPELTDQDPDENRFPGRAVSRLLRQAREASAEQQAEALRRLLDQMDERPEGGPREAAAVVVKRTG